MDSFIAIPSRVLQAEISDTAKLVYGALLAYQGIHYHAFASYQRIAERVGCSQRSVVTAIGKLREAGFIEPVMAHRLVDGVEVQFQQRGGQQGGRTLCWRCLVGLPKSRVQVISRPRRVK